MVVPRGPELKRSGGTRRPGSTFDPRHPLDTAMYRYTKYSEETASSSSETDRQSGQHILEYESKNYCLNVVLFVLSSFKD